MCIFFSKYVGNFCGDLQQCKNRIDEPCNLEILKKLKASYVTSA